MLPSTLELCLHYCEKLNKTYTDLYSFNKPPLSCPITLFYGPFILEAFPGNSGRWFPGLVASSQISNFILLLQTSNTQLCINTFDSFSGSTFYYFWVNCYRMHLVNSCIFYIFFLSKHNTLICQKHVMCYKANYK